MARLPQGVRKRNDGLYEKRFTINGVRYSVYGASIKALAEKEQTLREEINAKSYVKNRSITLDQYFDKWIETKATSTKSNTICTYKSIYKHHIKNCLGNRKVKDIERREITQLQSMLSQTLTPVSVNFVISEINIIFNDAIKDEIITRNPACHIKPIKVIKKATESYHRALTEQEQKAFMDALKGSYYYHFIAFMLCTGMRYGEVGALTWQDIDYENNVIHISKTITKNEKDYLTIGTPKTDAGKRDIPLTDTVKELMADYKKQYDNVLPFATKHIFVSEYGNLIANAQVNKEIKRVLNKLENEGIQIDYFTTHALRDTFATRFIEQGGSMQTLKTLLGHKSIAMTMDIYAHVLPNTKQEEMDKIIIAI